ncbi:hypothetical protein DXA67_16600, partial [Bacteroides fragilis]
IIILYKGEVFRRGRKGYLLRKGGERVFWGGIAEKNRGFNGSLTEFKRELNRKYDGILTGIEWELNGIQTLTLLMRLGRYLFQGRK